MSLSGYEQLLAALPGQPVLISGELIRFAGGISEAILLSRLAAWSEITDDAWFTKTTAEISAATALSPSQVVDARRNLRLRELIEEVRRGLPARLFYRVNADAIMRPRLAIAAPQYRKHRIPLELRVAVLKRDGYACRRCGASDHLQADHIIPEAKGGPTTAANLQTLCRTCNQQKGVRA
jgi:5-methylcytosine-specific restriction endonuclease McrA